MKVPSGTNLEILAELPKFLEHLTAENKALKKEIAAIKKSKDDAIYDDSVVTERLSKLEHAIGDIETYDDSELALSIRKLEDGVSKLSNYDDTELTERVNSIKPYDDKELKEAIDSSTRLSKRADSRFRNLASLVDRELRSLKKSLESAKYDDSKLTEGVKKALEFIDNFKPYDDERLIKMIDSIDVYDDKDIRSQLGSVKSEIKAAIMDIDLSKDAIGNIKPYDDKSIFEMLDKINVRIQYIEKALGVK